MAWKENSDYENDIVQASFFQQLSENDIVQASFHITIEMESDSEAPEDEVDNAHLALEDKGLKTVDELKEVEHVRQKLWKLRTEWSLKVKDENLKQLEIGFVREV